jgi:hypothetical protein
LLIQSANLLMFPPNRSGTGLLYQDLHEF